MKVLFRNVFENASFSATNESLNYPVSNLIHPFLRKRFQSSGISSIITASFEDDQIMDCFFYGWNNLESLDVVFKNSVDAILLSVNITEPEDVGSFYFSKLTSVRSVEITVNGLIGVFLGGVGAGLCYAMPNPLASYDPGSTDNSSSIESPYGQTLQSYIKPLRELEYGFRDQTLEIRKEVESLYRSVGIGKPIYFDLYEEDREKEPQIYGKIVNALRFPYSPRRHNFTIKIREAR